MKTIEYKAEERGEADYGWLKAKYSFSFANYYNPTKEHFGALRVLNDDIIQGGMGFADHPHKNMEIITIPLRGKLKHKDSISQKWITLKSGEVQVMSAGSGIVHAEKNGSETEEINLFQIWIIPDKMNVDPYYNQMKFKKIDRKNKLQILVNSVDNFDKDILKINQDARISRIDLDREKTFSYSLKSVYHGVYIMLISGEINVENKVLKKRDAIGVFQTESCVINAIEDAEILFIEVPMKF